jgi:hypothetical protein
VVEGGEKILTEKDLLFTDMDMDTRPEDIKFESRNGEGALTPVDSAPFPSPPLARSNVLNTLLEKTTCTCLITPSTDSGRLALTGDHFVSLGHAPATSWTTIGA